MAAPALPASIEIFDTTLRDGAQFEGISRSSTELTADTSAAVPTTNISSAT